MKSANLLTTCVGLATAALVAGCATGKFGELPPVTDPSKAGEVNVIRVSHMVGSATSMMLSVNGNEFFGIRNGQYTRFQLPAGEHYIGVVCIGGWSPTPKEDSVKSYIAPGSKSYFLIKPDMKCASIEQISAEEGLKRIKRSSYAPMGSQ